MSNEFIRARKSNRVIEEVDANARKRRGNGLFWWTLLIMLLGVGAVASWFFSIFVFSFPEQPRHYKLLAKLEKLPEFVEFDRKSLPQGRFQSARQIFGRYHPFVNASPDIVREYNAELKRAYIRNFDGTKNLPYLRGEFVVYRVRALTENDPITSGVVVRARSDDFPKLAVEYYFPGEEDTINPSLFEKGVVLNAGRTGASSDYATPIHVRSEPENYMCVSVIPLMYQYQQDKNVVLRLTPPTTLNIEGSWEAFPPDVSLESEEEENSGENEAAKKPAKAIKLEVE